MPEIFIEIYNAVRDNDMRKAKERQKIATSIIMHCVKYNYFSLMRKGLSLLGVRSGYCREPFGDLSEEELSAIKKELIALKEEMNITGVDFMEQL